MYSAAELRAWRGAQREALVAARLALSETTLGAWRVAMDAHIEQHFPQLAHAAVGFCWPFKNEYDSRFLIRRLRDRGAVAALPVVVAPKTPLIFREWHPGVAMVEGVYGIPYPAASAEVMPTAVLLPMNGFDRQGYRLGYGGGFFDRTLASLSVLNARPLVIGVTYELAAMETIQPQDYDIPMDYVVTEQAVYRREASGLAKIEGVS